MQFAETTAFYLLLLIPLLWLLFIWSGRRKRRALEQLGDTDLDRKSVV